jgi:acyl-CoA dehydrogenase
MIFEPDPEEETFRQEMREIIAASLPGDMAERVRRSAHPSREDVSAWMAILHERGLSAASWPVEYGGRGWTGARRIIFEEECLYADAPAQHFANVHSIGPVIYSFGAEAQKARFLEPLLSGREIWCQGFSEPNAGSDLASLTTRAVRDGDDYVVNGHKIWTSDAQHADFMFALVRTDPGVAKQRGISMLLIDMKSPGVAVHPIRLIDGSYAVCEVLLENVRVPAENLVGGEGQGWTIAKFLLANERAFSAEVPNTKYDMRRLIELAKRERLGDAPLWDDPLFRARVAALQAEVDALEFSVLRAIGGEHTASDLASLVKIPGSELRQRVSELLVEALGAYGIADYPATYRGEDGLPGPIDARGVSATFTYRRATTVYGGANEVQRDIIAKANLRL